MINIKAKHDIEISGLSEELAQEFVQMLQPALEAELKVTVTEFVKANAARIKADMADDVDPFLQALGIPPAVVAKVKEFQRAVREELRSARPDDNYDAASYTAEGMRIHEEVERIHNNLQGDNPLELLWAQNNYFSADSAQRRRARDLLDKLEQKGAVVPHGTRHIAAVLDGSRRLQAAVERDAGMQQRLHSVVPGKTVTMDNGVTALVVDANKFMLDLGPTATRAVETFVPVLVHGYELQWYSGEQFVQIKE